MRQYFYIVGSSYQEGIEDTMSGKFQPIKRDTAYLLPPTVQDWLPENHLARFVMYIVDQLDLSELVKRYGGGGKEPCHPASLLALLFYGYAIVVFSSRKLEQAPHDSVAMRFIIADEHPVTTRSPSSASVFYQCWKACLCRY